MSDLSGVALAKPEARAASHIHSSPQLIMHYVYLLRSESTPAQTYIGYSTDLRARLRDHNAGRSVHTSKFTPWQLATYLGFSNKGTALAFEKYLKSHSGKAFAAKRLW